MVGYMNAWEVVFHNSIEVISLDAQALMVDIIITLYKV